AIAGGALELLRLGRFRHAVAQRFNQIGLTPFKKKLDIAHRFGVDLGRGQVLYARPETTLDVKLQTRTRMIAGQVYLARRNHEVPMNQVDDAISEIGRKVRTIICAAVLAQSARHIDAGKTLG